MKKTAPPANAGDTLRLLHELQVHHAELAQQQAEMELQRNELERQNEELRLAQMHAAQARDHYAELFEAAPLGYFTLNLDGLITAANTAAAGLLGLPRSEVIGKALVNFIASGQLPAYRQFLTRMVLHEDVKAGGNENCTAELRTSRGMTLVVRFDGRLNASGQEFLIATTDLTERVRVEAALAAARDAAELANRAKSSFLANMSHEIRTPLHIIVGLGHLLRRDLANTAQRRRVDQLCANSDHLLDLINDVLDISRIEAGRLTLDRRPFRLVDVVDRLLGVIATPARAKGLELEVDASQGVRDATLLGDPLRLAQILINLGGNAVKFTERGSIRIAIGSLGEGIDGLSLCFTVQDSGIGIDLAAQRHLFKAFTQADDSPTRAHGGSGLGLAISQRLVSMMGGRIVVDSQPGSGSRFSFELQLPRGDSFLPEAVRPAAPVDLGGRRVLFAEDHPLSQEILFEMLEDLGCDVDVASDGREAVECALSRDYDLILMDVQMPDMDGLAATQAIRKLPRHRATPIIALTANAFAEDRRRCLDAGMDDHLAKPVTPDTLGAALGRWLPLPEIARPAAAADDAAPIGIPGIFPPASMRGSPQRRAEYQRLLLRFADLHGDDMQLVEQHLANGRRDEARKVAHDLKGIAGLIGARGIAQLADDIMVALRAEGEADIALLIASCASALGQLVAATAALSPAPGA